MMLHRVRSLLSVDIPKHNNFEDCIELYKNKSINVYMQSYFTLEDIMLKMYFLECPKDSDIQELGKQVQEDIHIKNIKFKLWRM